MKDDGTERKSKLPTTWPVEVKRQGYTVKIYKVNRASGYTEFKLVYYAEGKRRFKTFADFDEAYREAGKVGGTFSKGDVQAISLTSHDRLVYLRALDLLKDLDVPLDVAVAHYADAKRQLGTHSMKDAVGFYLKSQVEIADKSVSGAVAEFIRLGKFADKELPRLMRSLLWGSQEYSAFEERMKKEADKQDCDPQDLEDSREWPDFKW